MWTTQESTRNRYVNDFYEFKYVILVAILDFGLYRLYYLDIDGSYT